MKNTPSHKEAAVSAFSAPVSTHPVKHWHSVLAGALTGVAIAAATYPTEGNKKRLQAKRPVVFWPPREVYRGATAFACSLVPTTILQFCFYEILHEKVSTLHALSGADRLVAEKNVNVLTALTAGALGAFASTPVEHVILEQQTHKCGPAQAVKNLVSQSPFRPWTGLMQLGFREMGFGSYMLLFGHKAGDISEKMIGSPFPTADRFVGVLAGGTIGTALTHPFDTICTQRQMQAKPLSFFKMVEQIYKASGVKGFYPGMLWRILLFTGAGIVGDGCYHPIHDAIVEADTNGIQALVDKNGLFSKVKQTTTEASPSANDAVNSKSKSL